MLFPGFRSPRQQDEILRKVRRGSMDIVVGTHRLVSKDVKFHDLGLVIIDEEQRFGVAQKEKLKQMCSTADVLTLSATPIPRTLNMALSGIRDMSVIEEAPHDRHPVQTYVLEYDTGVIGMPSAGSCAGAARCITCTTTWPLCKAPWRASSRLAPEARIGVGHGKMNEEDLSEVWRQLLDHEN